MLNSRQTINLLFTLTFLVGCNDNSNPTISTKIKDTLTTTSVVSESTFEINQGLHVSKDLLQELEKVTPWQLENGNLNVDTIVNLKNDTCYIIYEIATGVCLTKYVVTFQDTKVIDLEKLEQGCDSDLGQPRYEWTEERRSSFRTFKKILFVQTPKDKNTINEKGEFRKGYSMDNVDMQIDSTTIFISINTDATFRRDTTKHSH